MTISKITLAAAICLGLTVPNAKADVMIGVHLGAANDPKWQAEIAALEAKIGRPLAIDSDYNDWAVFPDVPRIKWDMQTGHVPMQNWRVPFQDINPNACATAAAIVAGTYDTQLAQQAAATKALGGLILLRFNWEMTNNAVNTCFTGFPVYQNIPLAGQEYIAAWRHVVGVFRAAGVTNVKWIWAPGADAFINNVWSYFYPGTTWVDWIGVDDYNQLDTPVSFATDAGVAEFDAAITPLGKPMMISENAAFNDANLNPDPQTLWINTARAYLKQHPEISAYVYWDTGTTILPPPPYTGAGYYLTGTGLSAFKSMANDPYFGRMAP